MNKTLELAKQFAFREFGADGVHRELARAVLVLWPVYEAAIRVQNSYRWPPSNEMHISRPSACNDLAQALAATTEELG